MLQVVPTSSICLLATASVPATAASRHVPLQRIMLSQKAVVLSLQPLGLRFNSIGILLRCLGILLGLVQLVLQGQMSRGQRDGGVTQL